MKQTGVKHGLVALCNMQEGGDNAGVYNMQGTGNTATRTWSPLIDFRTLWVGRFVNSGLETGARKRLQSDLRY